MRTREKILLLLLATTLALGAAVYVQTRHDEVPLMRFRSFLLHQPLRNVNQALTSFSESSSANGSATVLGYGLIALVAVIIAGIAFKSAGNAELRAFRDRLVEMQVARAEAEALLQDALWKEKNARAAREAALQELETNASRMVALEDQLSDAERLLKKREAELRALQSRMAIAPEPAVKPSLAAADDARALQEELRKTTELLKSKETAFAELEKGLAERIDSLDEELRSSEKRRKHGEAEISALRAELLGAQAANADAQIVRGNELKKYKDELATRNAALRELEQALTAKIRALEEQATSQQELVESRGAELEALRSELSLVTARLANVTSAKERAEHSLRQELEQKAALLQVKDKALRELQEQSTASIRSLESQLAGYETRSRERDQEIAHLKNQLAEAGAIKDRTENSLADELRKEKQARAAQDAALRELERNHIARTESLNAELREIRALYQSRGTELEESKSQMTALTAQLAEVESAKGRVELLLDQELKNRAAAFQEKDLGFKEAQAKAAAAMRALEGRLTEKEAALAQRHAELEAMGAQLAGAEEASREKEERLRQVLREKSEIERAKDLAVRELEENLAKVAAAAKSEISERDNLLKSRADALDRLRAEVNALSAQLKEASTATTRHDEHARGEAATEAASKKLEESSKKILALESALREKEDLLKTHDGKIERLETELKEKRTELAKHEIAVWQAYEKRALWKQRLAKFGISMKER